MEMYHYYMIILKFVHYYFIFYMAYIYGKPSTGNILTKT